MIDHNDSKTRVITSRKSSIEENSESATAFCPKAPRPAVDDVTRFEPSRRTTQRNPNDEALLSGPPKDFGVGTRSGGSGPSTDSAAENWLKNRFLLEDVLGAGGMGVVYKARDRLKVEAQDRDPYVAIKVLSEEFKSHPEAFIALQRESRKTQRIAHPNIVNVHDFDRDGDKVFMTMEFLDGKPLDKLLAQYRSTGLPREECFQILDGICSALEYAHTESIIHSDLKPGNIFINNRGIPKVFDFGIARAVAKADRHDGSPDDKTVFDAGNLGALTPAYASKEMLEGLPPDTRDDVYALGCIAYEIFSGEHPFNRRHADEACSEHLKPKRIPGLNRYQWQAIERCLAFSRNDRTPSVTEFRRSFRQKKVAITKYLVGTAILLASMAVTAYQYRSEWVPALSDLDERAEMEKQARLEIRRNELIRLVEDARFTDSWQADLWDSYRELRILLLGGDAWLEQQREVIYRAYLNRIDRHLKNREFQETQPLLENARRYATQEDSLQALVESVDSQWAEVRAEDKDREASRRERQALALKEAQRREKQEKVAREFSVAPNTVNRQLNCRQQLNMDDLEVAIQKLRELDIERFSQERPRIVDELSQWIESIGRAFPDRALVFKQRAMQMLPRSARVAGIAIAPKDPCAADLTGAGARGPRAGCRDTLEGVGAGPSLVVVPGLRGRAPYAIGREEVRISDYNRFCRVTGCEQLTLNHDELPATNITIEQARSYAHWLSELSGYRYRLPTIEEWLHAAEAVDAQVDPNRNCRFASRGIERGGSLGRAGVGRKNRLGLVNYLGNAQEWALKGNKIVALGGSYDTPMAECSLAYQQAHDGTADVQTGFRLIRELADQN